MRTKRSPWYLMSLGLYLGVTSGAALAESPAGDLPTATPIKYVVVIYPENSSFDRYFGIYPKAENPEGSPPFHARSGTPSVNGLTETLLNNNPNLSNPVIDDEPAGSNPFRIARLDSYTCDMNHDYTPELEARNQGLMNQYVAFGDKKGAQDSLQFCHENAADQLDTDLGYFDGNTVTALWNYAQSFAIGDNFFATATGESTRGHLNLVTGDVTGAVCGVAGKVYVNGDSTGYPECNGPADSTTTPPPPGNGFTATIVDDADGFWDVCSDGSKTAALGGRNVGDLLNDAKVPWGWFQGGFAVDASGECTSEHYKEAYCVAIDSSLQAECESQLILDYVPHYNVFQMFQSTANPQHLPPTSVGKVGYQDQANHLYDLSWFWQAAKAGHLPAVSFLKPANYQDGHPGQSEPLDEQYFIVDALNQLQRLPEWHQMAVIITWDDSDGWYDHVMPPIVNQSATSLDVGTGSEADKMLCGSVTDGDGARCSYGPRLPFLVISPWAKENYVSSVLMDQTSILRFIEDNFLKGERISETSFDNIAGSIEDVFDFDEPNFRRLFLDPSTGEIQ
jgi:phospholipase C